MDYEIRRIGAYYSIKCSFIAMSLVLFISILVGIYFHQLSVIPLYMILVLLFLPGILNFLQKKPPRNEAFKLAALKKKYGYTYEKNMYCSAVFLLELITLFIWYISMRSTLTVMLYVPIFTCIIGCSARIISFLLFTIITKRRLMQGKL